MRQELNNIYIQFQEALCGEHWPQARKFIAYANHYSPAEAAAMDMEMTLKRYPLETKVEYL